MTDITYTYTATERRDSQGAVFGKGDAANVKAVSVTVELASAAQNSTTFIKRIPSNARILGLSTVYFDDLASSGTPTMDIGLGSVDSNITSDPDALNDGINISSAAGSASLIKDIANYGKKAWEFVSGQTTDPSGSLDIYISIVDAASNATGTVTVELFYTTD